MRNDLKFRLQPAGLGYSRGAGGRKLEGAGEDFSGAHDVGILCSSTGSNCKIRSGSDEGLLRMTVSKLARMVEVEIFIYFSPSRPSPK